MATAWASEAVKTVGTIVEPAWTWNVIITVAVGMMVWSLRRKITEADKLKDTLIRQSIEALEKSIHEWQDGAKERTKGICDKLDTMRKEIATKVPHEYCHEKHEIVKQDINDLKAKIWT